ncbi:MAG: 3-deoxy-D-manno-octulosonic acid transferase [Planctomycetes bacterium]|nr:3-deoxy-D-manno-octulosonic acid transferase [Planctomycetota bacterium]
MIKIVLVLILDLAYAPTLGLHYCWHRFVTGKYGPKAPEKTGRLPDSLRTSPAAASRPGGGVFGEPPCLWLHAVSVGEVMASLELSRLFLADNPDWEIRVSTTTATGRSVAEKHFGPERVFYFPLDFSWMVERAFHCLRPALVVLMELELWPNFLAHAARLGVPVAVANARITERSVHRLALVPRLARRMAMAVEVWFCQTRLYADRLEKIGVPANRIQLTGSVKYDAVAEVIDAEAGRSCRRLLGCGERDYLAGGDLMVVGGSTHPGEERILLEALRRAGAGEERRRLAVLAPRHPERLDEVEKIAEEFGRVRRRSRLNAPEGGDGEADGGFDIVLVDSLGELAKIYAAADWVFVGGTLIRHGGQNFIEPCGLAKPTVTGPHLWNFAEAAELLESRRGMRIIQEPEELAGVFADWRRDPAAAVRMGESARAELLKHSGASRRMADGLKVIAERLKESRKRRDYWRF